MYNLVKRERDLAYADRDRLRGLLMDIRRDPQAAHWHEDIDALGTADQPTAAPMPPNAPTLDEIRARCSENVTEMCSGAAEYYRMQTIIRDRAALLAYYDRDVSAHRTADNSSTIPAKTAADCPERLHSAAPKGSE